MEIQEANKIEYSVSRGIEIKNMFSIYLEKYILHKYNILQNKYNLPKFTQAKIFYVQENPMSIKFRLLDNDKILSIEALLVPPENIKTINKLSKRDKTFSHQKCQCLSSFDERHFMTYFLTNVIYSPNYDIFSGYLKITEKYLIDNLDYENLRNDLLDILYDVLVMFEN